MHDRPHRSAGRPREDGFTLIELLVVVVIIGVLVAIAVPVYMSYRKNASNKVSMSDVRGAISAVEQYYGTYAAYPASAPLRSTSFYLTSTTGVVSDIKVTLSGKTYLTYYLPSPTSTSYLLCAGSTDGNKIFRYDSAAAGSIQPAVITNYNTCA